MSKPLRQSARTDDGTNLVWTLCSDPSLRAILDHLAEELAKEYVRLMQGAVLADAYAKLTPEKRQTS